MDDSGRSKITKDEINLVEFPFSLPCHRHPKGRTSIHVVEEAFDQEGRPTPREWTVRASADYGLPLTMDEEVLLGAARLLHKTGFKERHVYFTQYTFLKDLGRSHGSADYLKLKQSLNRLCGATIESKGTFYDAGSKCRVVRSFNLIDSYTLYERDGTSPNDQPFISSISFSEFLFQSFREGFIKTLDFDFYLALHLPIARKLFRYLDKHRYKNKVFHIDLMQLAQKLAITDSAYPSLVRKHLEPSHQELTDCGFLKQATFFRRGRSPAIRYTMAQPSEWKHDRAEKKPKVPSKPSEHPLLKELVARGITKDVARDLLRQNNEKLIADKLEVFDFLLQEESAMLSKNPAGFLRQSIEKDYAPPTGYISRADRQRRQEEELTALQRQKDAAQVEEQQRIEERAQMDAYWDALSVADREQIEQLVITAMPTFAQKKYRDEKASGKTGAGYYTWRTDRDKLLQRLMGSSSPTVPTSDTTGVESGATGSGARRAD